MNCTWNRVWITPFETNDLDAFVPEVWAQESLMILEANMVAANLVHQDFKNEIAAFGDVVNTRQPATFTAARKTNADDVTVQNAEATNVPVPLNQHVHTSFRIRDGEESKGFKNLRNEYLYPALLSIAEFMDQMVLGQSYSFLANNVGALGTAIDQDTIIDARKKMNQLKIPVAGRQCVIGPTGEANLLKVDDWVNANTVGDDGSALREGHLGRKMGINFFMDQFSPEVASGSTTVAGAVNLSAGYAAGSTTIACDTFTSTLVAGTWCTIAGDMTPQLITAATGSPTTSITISPGLGTAVVNNAVITAYSPGAINLAAGYATSYTKALTIDGFTVAPKQGQLISYGTNTARHMAMNTPTTTSIVLDRETQTALSDDDVIGVGPAGNYGFAFHRNCMALVMRPLAPPASGTGALSSVAQYKGLGIRVVITYDGVKQGHLVTVDLLAGVKVLDTNLGVVILG